MVPQASGTSSLAITMPKATTLEGDPGRTRQHPSTCPHVGVAAGDGAELHATSSTSCSCWRDHAWRPVSRACDERRAPEWATDREDELCRRAGEDMDPRRVEIDQLRRPRACARFRRLRRCRRILAARPQADSGPAAGLAGRSLQFAAEAVVDQLCRARRSRDSTLTRSSAPSCHNRRPATTASSWPRSRADLRFGLNSAVRAREGDGRWGSTAAAEDGGLRGSAGTPSALDLRPGSPYATPGAPIPAPRRTFPRFRRGAPSRYQSVESLDPDRPRRHRVRHGISAERRSRAE